MLSIYVSNCNSGCFSIVTKRYLRLLLAALSCFYDSKILNCIGALSFKDSKSNGEISFFWC